MALESVAILFNCVKRGVNAAAEPAAADEIVVALASWKAFYVIALDSDSLLSRARRAEERRTCSGKELK